MTEKENMLMCYRHQIPEYLPDMRSGLQIKLPAGFLEVPPYEQGGIDWFGVVWKTETPAAIPDPSAPRILTDITRWREQVRFPDLEAWDWKLAKQLDHVDEADRANKLYEVIIKEGPLERLHALMGMQEALEALLTEPEEAEAFVEAMTDFKCRLIGKVAAHYQPDIIMYHDDYGTQKNMMIAPQLWRGLFKPHLKRVVEACHAYGILFDLHSCGWIEPIVPELAEIGVDCLNCMAINDIPKLKRETENKMTFFVPFDIQRYAIADRTGCMREDSFREEISKTIRAYAEGGNYIPFHYPNDWWGSRVIVEEMESARFTIYP
jgi:hypothetical protein